MYDTKRKFNRTASMAVSLVALGEVAAGLSSFWLESSSPKRCP
jgi:hypothetical protein